MTISTTDKTIPRYKLSSGGSSKAVAWIEYAMKQRTAPNQRSMANPQNKFLHNFIHSGVVGGGVRALGPYFLKPSKAAFLVRPWSTLVPNQCAELLDIHPVDIKLQLLLELIQILP